MENGAGMGKAPPMGNPRPQPCFYLCGDGDRDEDDFESGDGNGKTIPGPGPPRCHPYSLGRGSFPHQS